MLYIDIIFTLYFKNNYGTVNHLSKMVDETKINSELSALRISLDQIDARLRKTLIERANIANKADADLFVSIHCDAFTSPKAFGAGTFVLGLHENERNFQ